MICKHQARAGSSGQAAEFIKRDIIRRAKRKRTITALSIVLLCALLGAAGYGVCRIVKSDKNAQTAVRSVVDAAVRKASGAIVEATQPKTDFDNVKNNIAIMQVIEGGVGTGFIAEMDGKVYLFSNEHVVRSLASPTATLLDGTKVELGRFYMSDRDLVRYEILSKIKSKPLQIRQDTPNIGEKISVYGNSNGGGVHTESRGVILGCGPDRLEIKADIVPGNSGGPVLDENGHVIGVSTYLKKIEEEKGREWVLQDTRYEGAVCRYALRFTKVQWEECEVEKYFVLVQKHQEKMKQLATRQKAEQENANSEQKQSDRR